MAGGFRSVLELSGVWLSKRTTAAPGGFRSVLELSGVWVTGSNGVAPEPEPTPTVSEWIVSARRRSRR